jgi:hypothetical protein
MKGYSNRGKAMTPIKRRDMPKFCPDCQAELRAYHGPGSITRLICAEKCSGYNEVVVIDHFAEARGESYAILLRTQRF